MKTKIHYYHFSGSADPKYKAMVEEIKANSEGRGHWMNAIPSGKDRGDLAKPNPEEIEIETQFIFGNQWNTTEASGNRRVFDWYEAAVYNGGIKSDVRWGHWLEITPEMAELRRVTLTCGYCGKHYGPQHDPKPDDDFCVACLDSPYLKETELHLLRLLPVAETIKDVFHYDRRERAVLTEEEKAVLLPRYVTRQTVGTDSRAVKRRDGQKAKVIEEYKSKSEALKAEHDGMLWLWDQGLDLENVIYYDHTKTFSFGWRKPVGKAVESKLLEIISEFPFAYEIKCEDGRKLEGYSEE